MPDIVWLIPLGALVGMLGCVLVRLIGGGEMAKAPAVLGLGVSAFAALWIAFARTGGAPLEIYEGYRWISVGSFLVNVDIRVDSLALFLLVVVTGISFLVACYSVGYMHKDRGYGRYFAVFSGFVFSMTMLVLADNLLVLFAFWEGVGVCSYLLIGFWYEKPSAAAAATKAFLVNRIADFGLLIGILLLGHVVGQVNANGSFLERFDYETIFSLSNEIAAEHSTLLGIIGALLLLGAIGKSAQFPLHVWLPDAMEGPTPVSALIHAATMVTAGVYLLARMSPLLVLTPNVLMTASILGGITALLGALIALFQHDLKRVLAYSTVSQLGYMFLGIGCAASLDLVGVAVMAAMFHLFTHAFFKALLFLSAGNVMHAMGDVIDMRRFGGLRKVLPVTNIAFLVGAIALSGIPPLAGFWSKDAILSVVERASEEGPARGLYAVLLFVGFFTALLTAIYTFRAYFRTFWGETRLPEEAGHHVHEAGTIMLLPIAVLAIGSILVGFLGPAGWVDSFLSKTPHLPEAHEHAESSIVMLLSAILGLSGALFAYFTIPKPGAVPVESALKRAGANRFYIDEIYGAFIVLPLQAISSLLAWFDRTIVNGLFEIIATVPRALGAAVRQTQTGIVQSYALLMAVGIVVLLITIVRQ